MRVVNGVLPHTISSWRSRSLSGSSGRRAFGDIDDFSDDVDFGDNIGDDVALVELTVIAAVVPALGQLGECGASEDELVAHVVLIWGLQ